MRFTTFTVRALVVAVLISQCSTIHTYPDFTALRSTVAAYSSQVVSYFSARSNTEWLLGTALIASLVINRVQAVAYVASRAELIEANTQRIALQGQHTVLQGEHDQLQENYDASQEEYTELQEERDQLQKACKKALSACSYWKGQRKVLQESNAKQTCTIAQLHRKISNLQTKLAYKLGWIHCSNALEANAKQEAEQEEERSSGGGTTPLATYFDAFAAQIPSDSESPRPPSGLSSPTLLVPLPTATQHTDKTAKQAVADEWESDEDDEEVDEEDPEEEEEDRSSGLGTSHSPNHNTLTSSSVLSFDNTVPKLSSSSSSVPVPLSLSRSAQASEESRSKSPSSRPASSRLSSPTPVSTQPTTTEQSAGNDTVPELQRSSSRNVSVPLSPGQIVPAVLLASEKSGSRSSSPRPASPRPGLVPVQTVATEQPTKPDVE